MKKIIKKLILSTILLSIPLTLFSETIVLKSGKAIEGKIIERTTDKIKIDFYGVPLTYYFDSIETIDGKPIRKSSSDYINAIKHETEQSKKWEEWLANESAQLYLKKMNEATLAAYSQASPIHKKIKKGSVRQALPDLKSFGQKSQDIIRQLTPPKELQRYHDKIIEGMKYANKSIEAMQRGDYEKALGYYRALIQTSIDEYEELKRAYITLGAPSEFLAKVDQFLTIKRNQLERIDLKKHPLVLPEESPFENKKLFNKSYNKAIQRILPAAKPLIFVLSVKIDKKYP